MKQHQQLYKVFKISDCKTLYLVYISEDTDVCQVLILTAL